MVVAPLLNLNERAAPSVKGNGFDAFEIGGNIDVGNGKVGGSRQKAFGGELFTVAEDAVDFGHSGVRFGANLRGAPRDDQKGVRVFASGFANRLPALAFGFARHGAGVDDDDVAVAFFQFLPDGGGFKSVQTTAESDDFRGHGGLSDSTG